MLWEGRGCYGEAQERTWGFRKGEGSEVGGNERSLEMLVANVRDLKSGRGIAALGGGIWF